MSRRTVEVSQENPERCRSSVSCEGSCRIELRVRSRFLIECVESDVETILLLLGVVGCRYVVTSCGGLY